MRFDQPQQPKPRTRARVRKPSAVLGQPAAVRFVRRPDAGMLVVADLDRVYDPETVAGAYVRIAPTLKASERSVFDSAAVKRVFIELGATAVIVAPIIVPDRAPSPRIPGEATRKSAEAWLSGWFAGVRGAEPATLESALAEALASAEQAGL